ncbi:MAG: DUF4167 domain-containing protein [Rhodospirillales bacterium]|tara:strand:+ start:592 stop:1200 length:609 start_codon:yes stop_codon:yes gene_type:complete
MKQSSNSRRSRGRNNGGKRSGNRNGNFDSHGPDGRIRGNASQVHEKYLSLARDALSSDDRISSENYSQHAEHFYRIMVHNAQMQANNDKTNSNDSSVNPSEKTSIKEKNAVLDQNEKNKPPRRNNRNTHRNRVAKNKDLEKNNTLNNMSSQISEEGEKMNPPQNDINQDDALEESALVSQNSNAEVTDNPNETENPIKKILA